MGCAQDFENALLSMDRVSAREIMTSGVENEGTLDFVSNTVVPALDSIGQGWESGKCALAQVYMSGTICEELVDEIIPVLEDYLLKHPMLTTDSGVYTTEPTWLFPEGIEIGDTTGVIPFEIGGIGSVHIGEELSLTVPVFRTLEQS